MVVKSLASFLTLYFVSLALPAQTNFCRITGSFTNKNFNSKIYLLHGSKPFVDIADMQIIDSTFSRNGIFSFKFPANFTDYYSIRLVNYEKGFVFIGSPGTTIKVVCDTSNYFYPVISGSRENKLRRDYITGLDPLIRVMNSYADSSSITGIDSVSYNRFSSLNQFWAMKIREYNFRFIKKFPASLTSLRMVESYYKLYSNEFIKSYLTKLPKALKSNPLTNQIAYNKFTLEPALHKISGFYDLKFHDTLKQNFNFEPYYGKIVLIDFWASWCKPCIANFPLLIKIDSLYGEKAFAIIGVSLDEDVDRWKTSLSHHRLPWANISDSMSFKSFAAKYLNVNSIPRYILLNERGKVINDNLSKEDIEETLNLLLK